MISIERPKSILITGIVNGEVLYGTGGAKTTTLFSIKLIEGISETLQKGTSLVVYHTGECYVRKGDEVKISGYVKRTRLRDGKESIYVWGRRIYNETLCFSFKW